MDPMDTREILEHSAWVRQVARAMIRDEHLAEDLAQEALEAGLRRREAPTGGLRAWLRGALRNLRLNAARNDGRRRERELRTEIPPPAPAPDELLEKVEAHRLLAEAVISLPEALRSALILRYYEGLPVREVSRALSITEKAAESRIHRGVQRLREIYLHRNGTHWEAALLPLHETSAGAIPALLVGTAIMTMKTKIYIAGACVLALFAAFGSYQWLTDPLTKNGNEALDSARLAAEAIDTAASAEPVTKDASGPPPEASITRSTLSSGWRLRVVDEADTPVPNAEIAVYGSRNASSQNLAAFFGSIEQQHGFRAPDLVATSDAEGRAVLQPLDQDLTGLLYVRASAFVWQAFLLPAGEGTNRDLGDHVLKPGGQLAFRVRDGDGRALPGVVLFFRASRFPGTPGSQSLQRGRTDERGLLVFDSLPLGSGDVMLGSPGFLRWQALGLEATARLAPPLEVVLDRGHVVQVLVEDARGVPVPGAELFVHSFLRFGPANRLVKEDSSFAGFTDDQGRAEIGGMTENGRLLLLVRSGACWTEHEIRFAEDPVVIRLPAMCTLSARFLRPDGSPLAGATAMLMDATRPTYSPEYSQELGADGSLSIVMPASTLALAVRHPQGSRVWEEEIALTKDLDLGDVLVPEGPVLVLNVRDAKSGEPVHGVSVRYDPAPVHFTQQDPPWREPLLETLWHEDSYEVSGSTVRCRQLFPGRHALRLTAPGYVEQVFEVELREGSTTESAVVMQPATRLRLIVQSSDGQPVVGEEFEIVGDSPSEPGREPRAGVSDEEGAMLFEGLQPGTWRFGYPSRAMSGQFLTEVELEAGSNERIVTVPTPVAVSVELVASGRSVANARVEFRREAAGERDGFENGGFSAESDAQGQARYSCKEPGRHLVRVFAPGLLPQQREVVIEGASQLLRFEWSGVRVAGRVVGGDGAAEVVLLEFLGTQKRDAPRHLRGMFQRGSSYVAISPSQRFLVAPVEAGGAFELGSVPRGSYWLIARAPRWRMSEPLAIEIGTEGSSDLFLKLEAAAEIVIEVVGVTEYRAAHPGKHLRFTFESDGEDCDGNPLGVGGDGECRILQAPARPGKLVVYEVTPRPFKLAQIAEIPLHPPAGQETRIFWDARTLSAGPPK